MATFKWNYAAFDQVRNSPAVLGILGDAAATRAARAGAGYEVRGPEAGRRRGRAAVITGTAEARRAEGKNHNLARS